MSQPSSTPSAQTPSPQAPENAVVHGKKDPQNAVVEYNKIHEEWLKLSNPSLTLDPNGPEMAKLFQNLLPVSDICRLRMLQSCPTTREFIALWIKVTQFMLTNQDKSSMRLFELDASSELIVTPSGNVDIKPFTQKHAIMQFFMRQQVDVTIVKQMPEAQFIQTPGILAQLWNTKEEEILPQPKYYMYVSWANVLLSEEQLLSKRL